jgi:hypothetical protein
MELTWSDIDKQLEHTKVDLGVRWIIEALRFEKFNPDSLSKCQMLSKIKLVNLLHFVGKANRVAICGSWYGQLATMLHRGGIGSEYVGIDIDPDVAEVASHVNRYIPFEHVVDDMYIHDYSDYDLVINTSCEHIEDIKDWLGAVPTGTMVALQSNNYLEGEGHVNCVESIQEFKEKAGLSVCIIEDELRMPLYTRFTLIGRV